MRWPNIRFHLTNSNLLPTKLANSKANVVKMELLVVLAAILLCNHDRIWCEPMCVALEMEYKISCRDNLFRLENTNSCNGSHIGSRIVLSLLLFACLLLLAQPIHSQSYSLSIVSNIILAGLVVEPAAGSTRGAAPYNCSKFDKLKKSSKHLIHIGQCSDVKRAQRIIFIYLLHTGSGVVCRCLGNSRPIRNTWEP